MKKRYQHNSVRTSIVVALTCLYFFVFESDYHGCNIDSFAGDIAAVEVVRQTPFFKSNETDSNKDLASSNQPERHISMLLKADYWYRERFVLADLIKKTYLTQQHHLNSAFHPIIPILQKNNTWHGSTEDETKIRRGSKTFPIV